MSKSTKRNAVQVAMMKRFASTTTTMRDRRERRPKDAKRSWKREEW